MNDFLQSASVEFDIDVEKLKDHWRTFSSGKTTVPKKTEKVKVTPIEAENSGTCNYKFSKGTNAGQFCKTKPKVGNFCSTHKKSENSTPKEPKEPKKKNIVSTKSPSPSKKNLDKVIKLNNIDI